MDDFIKILEGCDAEIQERYKYICEQLNQSAELSMEIIEAKEISNVEIEIARRMGDKARENQIKMGLKQIEKADQENEERYDILLDLRDEMEKEIMGIGVKGKRRDEKVRKLV
ncbi:MAG: hypothetical protein GX947_07665 [Tissierellia bacterium]|nr:hypothetical protein [Tissierellia bacterium]